MDSILYFTFKLFFCNWDPSESKESSLIRYPLRLLGYEIEYKNPLELLPKSNKVYDRFIFNEKIRNTIIKISKEPIFTTDNLEQAKILRFLIPDYLEWEDSYFNNFFGLLEMVLLSNPYFQIQIR